MHLHIPSTITCHPFTVYANQAFGSPVDTMWDEIKFIVEERVSKECLQALHGVVSEVSDNLVSSRERVVKLGSAPSHIPLCCAFTYWIDG